jgi:hypothetical protein
MQQLDRHFAMQTIVPRPEDEAHASATQSPQDLVRPEPLACLRNHDSDSPSLLPCRLLSFEDFYDASKDFRSFIMTSARSDSQLCLEQIPHSITNIG